jgi:hypothetical protein
VELWFRSQYRNLLHAMVGSIVTASRYSRQCPESGKIDFDRIQEAPFAADTKN